MSTPQDENPGSRPDSGGVLDRALALVEFLRARCPWDGAQTSSSLTRYLLEESHEVVDAIHAGDDAELRGELGDLLLNLAFQVVLGEERGAFDREGVVASLEQKMRRRHPHLYGLGPAEPWEELKARERPDGAPAQGVLGGLASGMDPLLRAFRIQERVAGVGFDWTDAHGAWEKVREEVEEVGEELSTGGRAALHEELGDLLFAAVNLVRLAGTDPVSALAAANAKFSRRFAAVERLAAERGMVLEEAGLEALDVIWDEVKAAERAGGTGPAAADAG